MTTSETIDADGVLLSDPPAWDALEISLFGPDKGESVVVHYGAGRWFIVDSCRDPATEMPAALSYLQRLGVDSSSVTHVVATHAHDDHVDGLAEILEACEEARFVCPVALTGKEFIALTEIDEELERLNRGVFREFRLIDSILQDRKNPENRLGSYWRGIEGRSFVDSEAAPGLPPVSVTALTPSDTAHTRSLAALASMYPTGGTKLPIGSPPNETCLALWISAGETRVVLGADVESGPADCGWRGVLAWPERPTGKADVYKVAHHGARSGHHQPMWDQLLVDAPISILTPNENGSYSLPTAADLTRITSASSRTLVTALPAKTDTGLQERARISRLGDLMRNPQRLERSLGHVRVRRQFGTGNAWEAEMSDPAMEVTVAMARPVEEALSKATSPNKSRQKADVKRAKKAARKASRSDPGDG